MLVTVNDSKYEIEQITYDQSREIVLGYKHDDSVVCCGLGSPMDNNRPMGAFLYFDYLQVLVGMDGIYGVAWWGIRDNNVAICLHTDPSNNQCTMITGKRNDMIHNKEKP